VAAEYLPPGQHSRHPNEPQIDDEPHGVQMTSEDPTNSIVFGHPNRVLFATRRTISHLHHKGIPAWRTSGAAIPERFSGPIRRLAHRVIASLRLEITHGNLLISEIIVRCPRRVPSNTFHFATQPGPRRENLRESATATGPNFFVR